MTSDAITIASNDTILAVSKRASAGYLLVAQQMLAKAHVFSTSGDACAAIKRRWQDG